MQLIPVKEWILQNPMHAKKTVTKAEFKTVFGGWLQEYVDHTKYMAYIKYLKAKHLMIVQRFVR